jgi:carbon monoxide dehydrogenase subunit G
MTVTVERSFDVEAPIETVWEVLSDPESRAKAISVVKDYEIRDDRTIWHIRIPLPLTNRTIAVKTRDVERDPPRYVKFVGESDIMRVTGEHELTETEDGCRVTVVFVVDGRIPGVEKFFERNIDGEIENIKKAVTDFIGTVEEV